MTLKRIDFARFTQHGKRRITKQLAMCLPSISVEPTRLHKAMRYVVLSSGKRLRPLLVYAVGRIFNAPLVLLDKAAKAVELIHTYSLVHDDLPAMDNDHWRRGQLSCHKAFDEGTAILVGDALQSLAFEQLIIETKIKAIEPSIIYQLIKILVKAIGSTGMAGGQLLDLQAEGCVISKTELYHMHQLKTGALISACVRMGAVAGNCKNLETLKILSQFSKAFGQAFQIRDDILDMEDSTTMSLGRNAVGNDVMKATYPAMLGLDGAKKEFHNQQQIACEALKKLKQEFSAKKSINCIDYLLHLVNNLSGIMFGKQKNK